MRILMVIADPLDEHLSPVVAYKEWQAITRAMAYQQASVTLYQMFPPTWQQLRQTLLGRRGPFDIVHFIGHGNSHELVLEDEFGCVDPVSATDLAGALAEGNVRLVVLNVCESESPADVLVQTGIPSAVATSGAITNRQAIIMSQELYGALAAERPLAEAVANARDVLRRSEGAEAADLPVILGDDSLCFDLPRPDADLPRSICMNLPRNNLRRPVTFFGRRDILRQGLQTLAAMSVRAVQVTGLGGIGKTAFGLQLAHRSAWRFFGGVVWLDTDVGGVPFYTYLTHQVANILAMHLTDDFVKDVEAVLKRLAEHPILLIFDDVDRLSAKDREDLATFLNRLPFRSGSKTILLTRTHMPILGEVDGMATIRLGGLDPDSARGFLRHHASLQGVRELAMAADTKVEEIAERLGYHPKMMELAVGLVRVMGLTGALRAFSQLPRSFAEKLRALLAESVAMLDETDLEVLRTAATFVRSFRREWLIRICGPQALDSLSVLMDANLVNRDELADDYEMHSVVRDYVLDAMPPEQTHLRSHAYLLAELVSELFPQSASKDVWNSRQELDHLIGEVREAVMRMRVLDDTEALTTARDLVTGVRDYLHFHCRDWATIELLDDAAAEVCRSLGDRAGLGAALTSLGSALAALGKVSDGLALCIEGIEHLTAAGDARSLSIGYGALGFVHRIQRDFPSAQSAYEQALAVGHELDVPSLEIRHLSNLGTVHRNMGNRKEAERLHRRAFDLAVAAGDQLSAAIVLDHLGIDARHQGDLSASLRHHQQAYQLKTAMKDEVGLRMTRNNLAVTLKQLGRPDEAVPLLEESLRGLDESDGTLEWWLVLLQLGRVHRDLNEWGIARYYYELALELAQTARDSRGISMCERGIGLCHEGEGHLGTAQEHIARAVEISTNIGDPYLPTLEKDLQRIEEKRSNA